MSTSRPVPTTFGLTVEQIKNGIVRLRRRVEDLESFETASIMHPRDSRIAALEKSIEETLERVFGSGSAEFSRYSGAAKLHEQWGVAMRYSGKGPPPALELQEEFAPLKAHSIALLNQAVSGLEEEIAERESSTSKPAVVAPQRALERKVFVVHGHDEGAREAVARFLERIGFEAVILHERASRNRTVIEKVEAHGDVGFAVVLLTPDDEGCTKGGTPKPRARQNVVLELGYFIGRLGRDQVCVLKRGEVETPSDFVAVVYEHFDASGGWHRALGRELQDAGFEIDWNKVMPP
jgi:predicted nucleotide-binding protein